LSQRAGQLSVLWTVRSEVPGRIRLFHDAVRSPALVAELAAAARRVDPRVELSASPLTSTLLVRFDAHAVSRDDLLAALSEALAASARLLAAESPAAGLEGGAERRPLPGHLVFSSATLLLSLAALPLPVLRLPTLLLALAGVAPIAGRAARAIVVEHRPRVDILDATVILAAIYYRQGAAAAFMIWVVDLSNVLLARSSDNASRRLRELFGYQVRKAWRLVGEAEVECDVAELQEGDVVVVRSADQIPVDGVVVEGAILVNQATLTGESVPVERLAGDAVFAMTLVVVGSARVRVTKTGAATNAAQMIRIVERSLEHRVGLQTKTQRFADLAVVPTMGLGVVAQRLRGTSAMLAVLNADYDSGIRFAGPIAMLSSLSTAARHGILVKNARALEELQQLDVLVFDKTGTLTVEVPRVGRVVPLAPRFDEAAILRLAGIAERRLSHPLARAIVARARELDLNLPVVTDSEYEIGFGVRVKVEGRVVRAGSRRYLVQEGIAMPAKVADLQATAAQGRSIVWLAVGKRLAGAIELEARPRPEASRLLDAIRRRPHIREIHLISGDTEAATRALAEELGIERYAAGMHPQEKFDFVRDLQRRGLRVGMVGDGFNDSAALSRADCSISLAGAAEVARDVADIVFLDGDLAKFPVLFEIADNLLANIRTSIALIAVPNTVLIAGAVLGVFGLPASLVLNNAFNLACAANGFRAQSSLDPWGHHLLPDEEAAPAS
jgi:heavy metal translocating P-type ATPase